MYVDVNTLKNTAYKNFFSQLLKNTEYVIVSMIDDSPRFKWNITPLPENVNFHDAFTTSNITPRNSIRWKNAAPTRITTAPRNFVWICSSVAVLKRSNALPTKLTAEPPPAT